MIFARLPGLAILDVTGNDAPRIANNLCTADIAKIDLYRGHESFVTEVRGKTLGHVCVFRTETGLRLIGSGCMDASGQHQAQVIAAHFDRYTLREQSVPVDRTDDANAIILDRDSSQCLDSVLGDLCDTDDPGKLSSMSLTIQSGGSTLRPLNAYRVPWWGPNGIVLIGDEESANTAVATLHARGAIEVNEESFHRHRIETRFPWFGIDLDASNLPQEADRDRFAISFTKGCYLGQETVARLDALGQVQKKLVAWKLTSRSLPKVGTELLDGDKVVGRLTSVTTTAVTNQFIALGFARRSHFAPGTKAQGLGADGETIEAIVSGGNE